VLPAVVPAVQYSHDAGMSEAPDGRLGMKIAFASGKGGTGKTTVAVNFAYHLASFNQQIQYLDCDVEEPNGHLFLKPATNGRKPVKVMVPVVDLDKCTFCGQCGAQCQFKAIVSFPGATMVFPELCHSCGLCVKICPEKAIREEEREVGYTEQGTAIKDIDFVHGVLSVGEPMATPVIRAVKEYYKDGYIKIIDAPPGTACPVVKTISDADMVVLVTEPTPFGLHDLKMASSVALSMDKPLGVVINREQGEYTPLKDYLAQNNLPLLMTLPEDKEIAKAYARGEITLSALPLYREHFVDLAINMGRLAHQIKRK
jgi:MinD superfamily P-loop ATPase